MALATRSTPRRARSPQRAWRAPTSPLRWLWLAGALALSGAAILLYAGALLTQAPVSPFNEPLRSLGLLALLLVLTTASYTLRRRFARSLPGKVQNWLWMHTWLGCAALLIALLHANITQVLFDSCPQASCLSAAYGGTGALLALLLTVSSGVSGRLLDLWQARRIARDASTNGVGIVQALEEHLLEQEYTLERLCAGKSEEFQSFCLLALAGGSLNMPTLAAHEQAEGAQAQQVLRTYARLRQSLQRQQRARLLMRRWRLLHIILSLFAFLVILFHATMELLSSVFHLF
ncbi:MAG TPA: hypothetical protein VGF67_10240 [Ktedonobacteraceae bacterium]|jgi:hypothetical protein